MDENFRIDGDNQPINQQGSAQNEQNVTPDYTAQNPNAQQEQSVPYYRQYQEQNNPYYTQPQNDYTAPQSTYTQPQNNYSAPQNGYYQQQGYSNQNYYQQPQYSQGYGYGAQNNQPMQYQSYDSKNGKGFAIASLVLGIVSLCTCCGGVLPALLGLIFGIVSKLRANKGNTMALVGIILSIIGLVLSVVIIVFMASDMADIDTSYHYNW